MRPCPSQSLEKGLAFHTSTSMGRVCARNDSISASLRNRAYSDIFLQLLKCFALAEDIRHFPETSDIPTVIKPLLHREFMSHKTTSAMILNYTAMRLRSGVGVCGSRQGLRNQ